MSAFNPPVWLAAFALMILGGMGAAMLFAPIPPANAQSVTFILGALAGALTMQSTGRSPGAALPALPQPQEKPL